MNTELVRHLRECDGAITLCRKAADEIEYQSTLYVMLMSRIDELMKLDPPADSHDGIRLVELAALCERFEKTRPQ